jgi:hypothetical protein
MGGLVQSPRQLSTLLSNTDWDLYVHINPTDMRRASPKASAREVTHLTNILLDIDLVSLDADPDAALDCALTELDLLAKGSRSATTLVHSGRGRQAWVSFHPLELSLPSLRHEVERATSALFRQLPTGQWGCRIDYSCSDVSRVARLPGSINQKTQTPAFVLSKGSTLCDPSLLLRFDPGPPPAVELPPSPRALGYVLPYVTARAARFFTSGVESPGRHAAAFAAAASLAELNIPFDTAVDWVAEGGALCNPRLSALEAHRATRNAYQKHESPR